MTATPIKLDEAQHRRADELSARIFGAFEDDAVLNCSDLVDEFTSELIYLRDALAAATHENAAKEIVRNKLVEALAVMTKELDELRKRLEAIDALSELKAAVKDAP